MRPRQAAALAVTLVAVAVVLWRTPRRSARAVGQEPPVIERLDSAADAIVPEHPTLHKLVTGYTWTEGPVWVREGYLLFAEIPSNTVRKLVPGDSAATLYLRPSGYLGSAPFGGREPGSNGMTLDPRGRLTVAGHGQRDVYRIESLADPARRTILADTYQGKRLNSPNDLVYRSDGSLYFTDPPYGLPRQDDTDPGREQPVNGVYRLSGAADQPPGAPPRRDRLKLVVSDLPRPNGIALSPDERVLYVSNTGPRKIWMRYRVKSDGTLDSGTIFFDASSDTRPGSPDGIKVDTAGNVYGTGPGGVWIFSSAGRHLATILVPEPASNVAWGGPEGRSLFITASTSVYQIDLKVPGVRP